MTAYKQKIALGQMRASGLDMLAAALIAAGASDILIYCTNADGRSDDVRPSDIESNGTRCRSKRRLGAADILSCAHGHR